MHVVIVGLLLTLTLHFAWEMLQAPAFMDFAASTWDGTVRCFAASVGDVLLTSGAYAVTALVFWQIAWPLQPRWVLPAAMWITLGVLATITFERWALATERWAYGPAMPLVFGVGLLPLLQWVIVPALTLVIIRVKARKLRAELARAGKTSPNSGSTYG
jgi:hypothetical protein